MYNRDALLDIHPRAHESLRRLIAFCSTLTTDDRHRPLSGFGFPKSCDNSNTRLGAEVYWQTVVLV